MRKSQYVMTFPVKEKYLLINGLSGAIRLVSKETAQKFFNGEVTPELKPFFTHLTPEKERKKAISLCEFMMKNVTKCVEGNIAITCGCNLRCPYCFEIWVKNPEIMKMVIDEHKVNKVFEALEDLNKECTDTKLLGLTGGEPLMKKNEDIVKYILKKGNELGYTFAVFTNGVELNYFLPHLSSVPIEYIQITLDGPQPLHDRRRIFKKGGGTFDIIVKNIEKARDMGLFLVVRTNTDPEILSHLDELAQFFKERGWVSDPNMAFPLAALYEQHVDPQKAEEYTGLYKKALDLAKRPELSFFDVHNFLRHFRRLLPLCKEPPTFWPAFWHCAAVTKRYIFDPFGDVYPCPSMLGWKEQRIGRYIPELRFNEKYYQWRNRTIFAMDKCTDCSLALVCGGECGYASLLREKDLYIPVCITTEELVVDFLECLYGKENE